MTMNMTQTSQADSPTRRQTLAGTRMGVVSSDKRDKTRTVTVTYQVRHPKYGKYLSRQSRFQVHDPDNVSKAGDQVEIVNCRPVSKTKSRRLVRVVEPAGAGV
jgi:small subunit ribosomal protein S17